MLDCYLAKADTGCLSEVPEVRHQRPTLLPREGKPELLGAPWPLEQEHRTAACRGWAFSTIVVFVEPGTGPQGYKEGESVQLALRAGGCCDQNGEDRRVLSGKIQKSGEREPFRGQVMPLEVS